MSTLYPENVDATDEQIAKLTKFFKGSYKRIVDEIETATDFGVANRRAILAQIDRILVDLGTDVQTFIDEEMPGFYKQGAVEGVKQLNNVGADVAVETGFNQLHKEAIVALIDDTVRAYAESLTGVKRSAALLLGRMTRDLMTEEIAHGLVTGEALKRTRQTLKGILSEQGLSALTDRAGRRWDLDRYAEMLFRTKAVEARNMGLVNRVVENGYDLVQVSSHVTSCDQCVPWQGMILSITGNTPGYPTMAQAQEGGLFHPNCRHAVNTVVPSLAKKTLAYNPDTGKIGKKGASIKEGTAAALDKSVIQPAIKYDKEFKNTIAKVAKEGDWNYSHGKVKKVERSVDKVINDYDGDVFALKDANRSVIFINNPYDKAEFERMKKSVVANFGGVERVKVGLNEGENYRKNMINIKAPDGHIAEIQVTTREMWEAKKDLGGDVLYHEWRETKKISVTDADKIYTQMTELYAQAERKTKERLGLS